MSASYTSKLPFMRRVLTAAATIVAAGCAEPENMIDDLYPGSLDGSSDASCVCTPRAEFSCTCPKGGKAVMTCLDDCQTFSECRCADAGVDAGGGGHSDAGGSAGAGGTLKDSGKDGDSGGGGGKAGHGGTGGSGGTTECTAPEDKCPGVQIELSPDTHKGSANGAAFGRCPDYQGSCNASSASADSVYWVKPDIDGVMSIKVAGSQSGRSVFVRTACDDPNTEVVCKTSDLNVAAKANTTYYVIIASTSSYDISVEVKPPGCGDAIVQPDINEECDDGNTEDGDGCAHDCKAEPPPPEDKCPGVEIPLSGSGNSPRVGTVSGNTAVGLPDAKGSCGNTNLSKDLVYSFTPDVTGEAVVKITYASGMFEAVIYVRKTCDDPTTQIDCMDGYINGDGDLVYPTIYPYFQVQAKRTYYVWVDGVYGDDGGEDQGKFDLSIKVTPIVCGNGKKETGEECDDGDTDDGDGCSKDCKIEPAGPADRCPGVALELEPSGDSYSASTKGSTLKAKADYEGSCIAESVESSDDVYQFNSGLGGRVRVELTKVGTDYDSLLYIRAGDCASGQSVKCVDTSGDGGEVVEFVAPANTNYWVFVDGADYEDYYIGTPSNGNYELLVNVRPPLCGNGVIEGSEECDDQNTKVGDGCDPDCKYESGCGGIPEQEPNNPETSPQLIPPACGSFTITPASLPVKDTDFFQMNLMGGVIFEAWTYVGTPGQCVAGADTVLSLWKSPMPASTNVSGACSSSGYVLCNDNNAPDPPYPCSHIGPYTIPNIAAGEHLLKVHNYSTTKAIADYGVLVVVK